MSEKQELSAQERGLITGMLDALRKVYAEGADLEKRLASLREIVQVRTQALEELVDLVCTQNGLNPKEWRLDLSQNAWVKIELTNGAPVSTLDAQEATAEALADEVVAPAPTQEPVQNDSLTTEQPPQ